MIEEIPKARDDGKCAVCSKRKAVTKDNVFCLRCLREFIKEQNPDIQNAYEDPRLENQYRDSTYTIRDLFDK